MGAGEWRLGAGGEDFLSPSLQPPISNPNVTSYGGSNGNQQL